MIYVCSSSTAAETLHFQRWQEKEKGRHSTDSCTGSRTWSKAWTRT